MFIVVSALLPVFNQLIFHPYLSTVMGYSQVIEFLVVAAVFIGFTVGLLANPNTKWLKYLFLFAAVYELIISFAYSEILLLGLTSSTVKTALFLFGFLLPVLAGISTTFALNFQLEKRLHTYANLNLASAAFVIAFIFLQSKLPLPYFHLLNSLCLIFIFLYLFNSKSLPKIDMGWRPLQTDTILLGLLSGLYVGLLLKTINLYSAPNGIEFFCYLFFSFLFLWLSSILQLIIPNRFKRFFSKSTIGLYALFTLMIVFLLLKYSGNNNISDTLTSISVDHAYLIYKVMTLLLLTSPYFFFSMSFGIQTQSYPHNTLLHLTIGNFLGFLSSIVILIFAQVQGLFLLFAAGSLFLFIKFSRPASTPSKKWLQAGFVLLIVFAFLIFNKSLEEKIIAAGIKNYFKMSYASRFTTALARSNQTKDIFKIKEQYGMDTGYLFSFGADFDVLGINNYVVSEHSITDYFRSHILDENFLNNKQKVLVLGLGNHHPLKRLESLKVHPPLNIDVVDNFSLFNTGSFRNFLAKEVQFDWSTSSTNFHYEDVFRFLINTPDNYYDLILWNLTNPNFGSTSYIYTKEFAQIISQKLSSNGVFIYLNSSNVSLDCTFMNEFTSVEFFPLTNRHPFLFMQKKKGAPLLQSLSAFQAPENWCSNVVTYSIARPFSPAEHYFSSSRQSAWVEKFEKALKENSNYTSQDPRNFDLWFYPWGGEKSPAPLFLSLPLTGQFSNWGQEIQKAILFNYKQPQSTPIIFVDNFSSESLNRKQNVHFIHQSSFRNITFGPLSDDAKKIEDIGIDKLNSLKYVDIFPIENSKLYRHSTLFSTALISSNFVFGSVFANQLRVANRVSFDQLDSFVQLDEKTLIFLSTQEEIEKLKNYAQTKKVLATIFLDPIRKFKADDFKFLSNPKFLTLWDESESSDNCSFEKSYAAQMGHPPSPLLATAYFTIQGILYNKPYLPHLVELQIKQNRFQTTQPKGVICQ